jgi:hypothetical protein
MKDIFEEIIEWLKYEQYQHEIFARLNDKYTPIHESRIGGLGDAIDIIRKTTDELWVSADEEPDTNGEYIIRCRRCHDDKEVVSSAKYCFGEWKISNAFDLICWTTYSRLFNRDECELEESED